MNGGKFMAWKTYTIKESKEQSLQDYLKEVLQVSSRDRQIIFRKKGAKVNHRLAHSKRILKKGDLVSLCLPQDRSYGLTVEKGPIDIIYEDAFTIVLNKPPFILVHPTGQTREHTLSNYLAGYYDKKGVVHKIRPLHRLDRDTSGCVLFAKTRDAHQYYADQLEKGHIIRIYRALVKGFMSGQGVIDAPIGEDFNHPNRRQVDEFGQIARTEYEVLESMENQSFLSLRIPTGRTHQIRVHLAHVGHPVIGDTMYGSRSPGYRRQCLHAYELRFVPYKASSEIIVRAEIPKQFGKEHK